MPLEDGRPEVGRARGPLGLGEHGGDGKGVQRAQDAAKRFVQHVSLVSTNQRKRRPIVSTVRLAATARLVHYRACSVTPANFSPRDRSNRVSVVTLANTQLLLEVSAVVFAKLALEWRDSSLLQKAGT